MPLQRVFILDGTGQDLLTDIPGFPATACSGARLDMASTRLTTFVPLVLGSTILLMDGMEDLMAADTVEVWGSLVLPVASAVELVVSMEAEVFTPTDAVEIHSDLEIA